MTKDNEDAAIEYQRLIKSGESAAEATRITGWKPEKVDTKNIKPRTSLRSFMNMRNAPKKEMERIYLNVPYSEKEQAKKFFKEVGVQFTWDPTHGSHGEWYVEIPKGTRFDAFILGPTRAKWLKD